MKIQLLIAFVLLHFLNAVYAQNLTSNNQREILVYRVIAKTKEGRVNGELQNVSKDKVLISTNQGIKTLDAESIKSISVKFEKKKSVPILEKVAKTGLAVISDPDLSTNHYSNEAEAHAYTGDKEEATLGEKLLVGSALITGAVIGNELSKLVPPATIEKFKINYSLEKYQALYQDLAMYSIDLQSSPNYDLILKNSLKTAIDKNKIKK